MTVSGLICALRYFHSLLRGENFVFKTKTNRIHSRHVKRKTKWCVHIFLQLVHNFVFINTSLTDSSPYICNKVQLVRSYKRP